MRSARALEAHHAAARKIVLTVYQALEQLESGQDTSLELQSSVCAQLNALARELQDMEEQLESEGAERRNLWRRRVTELQDTVRSQRAALSKFMGRASSLQREREARDELLGVRVPRASAHGRRTPSRAATRARSVGEGTTRTR